MNIFDFMNEHWFLAFLIICSVYYLLKGILITIWRFIRHLNIRKQGWPPEYLDADGDFKEES